MDSGVPICVNNSSNNVDERPTEERAINGLPINSKTAKWWFSTFHIVTATVGVGVLSLPYTMSELGWGPGVLALVISWIVTLCTLWQMTQLHEMVPGKRFHSYHELGQHAFGDRLGLWLVLPFVLIAEVGADIIYMITGGQSLKKLYDLICQDCKAIKLTYFIMIFASVHFILSLVPSSHSISGIVLAAMAMVMCVSYSAIAWGASIEKGVQPDVQYGYKALTTIGTVFNFLSGLGAVAFAYGCHSIVMEIQATMPSTPERSSNRPMWRGVIVAYVVVAVCYFPVALIGFWIFGNAAEQNIFIDLEKPRWLIAMANMLVIIHIIGAYQAYAVPLYDIIETVLAMKLKLRPSWYLSFITRNIYVAITMFIAITFPFFNALVGFFGCFAIAPTTYILPCFIWLAICKPERFSLNWFANWVCIIFGVLLMVGGSIAGLRDIILQRYSYQYYQ